METPTIDIIKYNADIVPNYRYFHSIPPTSGRLLLHQGCGCGGGGGGGGGSDDEFIINEILHEQGWVSDIGSWTAVPLYGLI